MKKTKKALVSLVFLSLLIVNFVNTEDAKAVILGPAEYGHIAIFDNYLVSSVTEPSKNSNYNIHTLFIYDIANDKKIIIDSDTLSVTSNKSQIYYYYTVNENYVAFLKSNDNYIYIYDIGKNIILPDLTHTNRMDFYMSGDNIIYGDFDLQTYTDELYIYNIQNTTKKKLNTKNLYPSTYALSPVENGTLAYIQNNITTTSCIQNISLDTGFLSKNSQSYKIKPVLKIKNCTNIISDFLMDKDYFAWNEASVKTSFNILKISDLVQGNSKIYTVTSSFNNVVSIHDIHTNKKGELSYVYLKRKNISGNNPFSSPPLYSELIVDQNGKQTIIYGGHEDVVRAKITKDYVVYMMDNYLNQQIVLVDLKTMISKSL